MIILPPVRRWQKMLMPAVVPEFEISEGIGAEVFWEPRDSR
jgi:hypothetical protein